MQCVVSYANSALENLLDWSFENELLTLQASGDLGPSRVVERPKVIYNDNTKKYVMWLHIDDSSYAEARAGVATSDTVCGAYTYLYVRPFSRR